MNLPDFFILGETKCGTTSLYNYLQQHPRIIDTMGNGQNYDHEYRTKEIRYFDRYFNLGLEWYKSRFSETRPGEIAGEATPMYLFRTISIRRIKAICPQAALIVLLREPAARLYSNYQHNCKWVPGFREKYRDFNLFWHTVHDQDYYLVEKGLYYYTLLKWFDHFPRQQFCIIRSEDLFENTREICSRVFAFLGLPDHRLAEIRVFRVNDYPPPDEILRREIENFYEEYNKKLADLLGTGPFWTYR